MHINAQGTISEFWPLKVLRLLAFLLKSVLLIPVTNIFAAAVNCNYGTGNLVIFPDKSCLTDNLFPYVGSIIGLCVFIPYSVLSPIVFLDARPSPKKYPGTQAQGEADVFYSVIRVLLVFVHVFAAGKGLTYFVLICNCVAFGFLFYTFSLGLPFYSFLLNRIRTGSLVAVISSSISSMITYSLSADETSTLVAQIVTASVGAGIGFYAPPVTRQRITQVVYARMKEEIDLNGSSGTKDGAAKTVNTGKELEVLKEDPNSFLVHPEEIDLIAKTFTVERPPIFEHETDVEIACRFVRHNKSANGKGLMHFIFRSGLQQYPKSVYLHATYAFYIQEYDSDKEKQAQQLVRQCSRTLQPKFTDQPLLFFIQRSLESAQRPGTADDDNKLSISSFAEYQSLEASARLFHTQTLEELRGFWGYLSSSTVVVRALPVFAQKIMVAERKGDAYYKKLISRFPKSKVILRMYATWLRQIKNDVELANEFFELANQIENAETNEGVQKLSREEGLDQIGRDEEDVEERAHSDVGGDDEKDDNYCPDGYLLRRATESLNNMGSESAVNFRVHTGSFMDFQPPPAPTHGERPGAIKQTAVLSDDKVNDPNEEVDKLGTPPAVQETVRQPAFLDPETISPSRRASEMRTVMISDAGEPGVSQIEKVDYAKGPRSESNASSSASTKAARTKRIQKSQLEIRLTHEIHTFGVRVIGLNVIFLAMVIATYIVASGQFSSFNQQLDNIKISTRLGIRAALLSHLLREQMLTAQAGDAAGFAAAKTEFLSELDLWRSLALPFLQAYFNNPYFIRAHVSQYPNGTGEFVWLNEYGVGTSVYQYSLQLNSSMEKFSDPNISRNNYFRFFSAPNMLDIAQPIDMLSQVNQESFIKMSESSMTTLYALIAVITLTVIGSAVGLFYPMIKNSGSTQVKVMKLFTVLSKKACRHIYTDIEEDLENFIATGDDQEIQLANEAKLRVSPTMSAGNMASQSSNKKFLQIFAMWLGAIFISTLAVFVPPIVFELDGVTTVKTINWSDGRRYKVMAVLRTSIELAAHDDEALMQYVNTDLIVANLNDAINILEDYHRLVTTGHGSGGVQLDIEPLANMAYIQDLTSIPGVCLRLAEGSCDPNVRVYNESIGLTQSTVLSGLDNVIDNFIEAAKRFAGTSVTDLSVQDGHYIFMRSTLNDIREGLYRVVDRLIANQSSKSNLYRAIMTALFPIAMLVIVCSFVAFRLIVQDRVLEMHQIIQLLFSIPYTMMEEHPQLSQYIQSGGVLGLEEKD